MKITVVSDLHLEFDPMFRMTNPGSDVLVLSGDILVAELLRKLKKEEHQIEKKEMKKYVTAKAFYEFMQSVTDQWEKVFYIAGNHEYYHGWVEETIPILKETLVFDNLTILENEFEDYKGFRFIGTTLWTDLNKDDPFTGFAVSQAMNDFRLIHHKKPYRNFKTYDMIRMHNIAKVNIDVMSADQERVIVLGHHAPSSLSIHEDYKGDFHINGAYYSDLSNFILDRPQIKLWTHGHMHNSFDYMMGDTKVVCNPKGYGDQNKSFNSELIIEV